MLNGLVILVGLGVFFVVLDKLGDIATRNTARKIVDSVDTEKIIKEVIKSNLKK